MREIKFRAWHRDFKRMLYKNFFDHHWYTTPRNDAEGCHTFASMQYSDQHHIDLMQYTGLKDKNGKEIYEGDVVCEKGSYQSGTYHWENKYKIECDAPNGGFSLRGIPDNEYEDLAYQKLEVIGNIYENPELKC